MVSREEERIWKELGGEHDQNIWYKTFNKTINNTFKKHYRLQKIHINWLLSNNKWSSLKLQQHYTDLACIYVFMKKKDINLKEHKGVCIFEGMKGKVE